MSKKRRFIRKVPRLGKPFNSKYGKMRSIIGYRRIFER